MSIPSARVFSEFSSCAIADCLKRVHFRHHPVVLEILGRLGGEASDRWAEAYAASGLLMGSESFKVTADSRGGTHTGLRRCLQARDAHDCFGDVSFRVQHRFVINNGATDAEVPIVYIDGTWRTDFGDMVVPMSQTLRVRFYEVLESVDHMHIDFEVCEEAIETSPATLFAAMKYRWLTPGKRYVFLMRALDGTLRMVFVEWCIKGWGICAGTFSEQFRHSPGVMIATHVVT